jgi:hypothetical protein
MEIKRYGKIKATKMEMDNDVINKDGCSEKKSVINFNKEQMSNLCV